jgi:glutathionyl-hydroquinone reductase
MISTTRNTSRIFISRPILIIPEGTLQILTFGSLKSINPYHRFSVPVLWDNQTSTVVNNESSEIIRILNTAFNHLLPEKYANLDLYPSGLQAEIDSTNEWLYESVNSQYLLGSMTLYYVH